MFRFKALQKMREPDELDSPSLLAAPRGWIAIFVLLFVMAAALAWSFLGSIPVSATSAGLLTHADGTTLVASPISGTVTSVEVRPGADLSAEDSLAVVTTDSGSDTIRSPFRGRVVGLAVSQAQLVDRGTPIATVERVRSKDDPIVAMLFAPEREAQSMRPSQEVDLSVPTAPAARFGLLRGRISSVSEFPLTSGQVAALVGGDLAARSYTAVSAPHLVVVVLDRDPATRSGYSWTTAAGPPAELRSQVPVTATVHVARLAPIRLLFGR